MKTRKIVLDLKNEKSWNMDYAISTIKNGGLVAFPTETVYGLGGDATNKEASKKIYAAKGRPSDNPLIVHIFDFNQAEKICKNIPKDAYILAEKFWPGPMTMILEKNDLIPYETTGGLDTVAIRMPSNKVSREFLRKSNVLIAAPSANLSGRPSPTKAEHVLNDLDGKIDCVIDGGDATIGLESTIVDLSTEKITILRPGYINKEMLEEALGKEVIIDPAILDTNKLKNIRPKAPGMKYKHYAPKGNLTIVEGKKEKVIENINKYVINAKNKGKKTGVIALDDTKNMYNADVIISIGTRDNEYEVAKNLYSALRRFDDENVEIIYSESFFTPKIGQAIMNRLLKAAGHHIIKVD